MVVVVVVVATGRGRRLLQWLCEYIENSVAVGMSSACFQRS